MIIYKTDHWIKTVFTCTGTAWPNIVRPFLCWVVFVTVCFFAADLFELQVNKEGHTVLGGTISFLLIFRANNAYARYWHGRTSVNTFFDDLRNIVMISLTHIKTRRVLAGESHPDYKMEELLESCEKLRTDIVRLTVAYAVVLKMYTRIGLDGYIFGAISKETKWLLDWDRFRLQQLLEPAEYAFVEGNLGIEHDAKDQKQTLKGLFDQFKKHDQPPHSWPSSFRVDTKHKCRMDIPVVFFLREAWASTMNDFNNTVPWGIKERFVPILSNILHQTQFSFETVSQIMTTPLPLPYACLCKTLLTIWMGSYPFVVDYKLGYFGGAVIPILVVFALLGIDAIATELENPFGDDANDIDFIELISNLEDEVMEMLALCDTESKPGFSWRALPGFISETSCKPVRRQLVVTALALGEVLQDTDKGKDQDKDMGRASKGKRK